MRLGSISKKINQIFDEADVLEVSVGSALNKHVIFRSKYQKDMLFYLQNKDL